ncbi:2'-5' RNA ligase family protein [Marinoscillum sp. MHG1-6]|uniref:2'-5' RNA ligase family protein n=1 Tax=Marinoscillum sp. MHG1-6 TaxID=2959627 RepID=UPI002157B3E8|nr:2'-5' RNA ligase family protein [Marinoscillum sp. MHG1-6]
MKNSSLYFIALVPDEPFLSEVKALKQLVAERFGSKAALRSPAHITLHMPFRYDETKEEKLIDALKTFTQEIHSLKVSQSGFGAFEPRVIFVNVTKTLELTTLQQELLRFTRKTLNLDSENYKGQGFHPHMTIAFRDLRKSKFFEAWTYFEQRQIDMNWDAHSLKLLKHNGSIWEIYEYMPFAMG